MVIFYHTLSCLLQEYDLDHVLEFLFSDIEDKKENIRRDIRQEAARGSIVPAAGTYYQVNASDEEWQGQLNVGLLEL